MDSFTLFFRAFFYEAQVVIECVMTSKVVRQSQSQSLSCFFGALRTSILYSSFLIYILLLISYKNYKRGVTSWIVTFSQLRLRLETATEELEKHTAHHRNSTFIYTH